MAVAEIYPSRDGIKVEFKVTAEILKKYEKLALAGARAKAKKENVEGGGAEGEVDEFDSLVNANPKKEPGIKKEPGVKKEPGPVVKKETAVKKEKATRAPKEPKAKKASDGLKQAKLSFGSKKSSVMNML